MRNEVATVSKRRWADIEEGMRSIERGVFDDSSLDTMPLGDKEERVPSASALKRLRRRRPTVPPPAADRSGRAAG